MEGQPGQPGQTVELPTEDLLYLQKLELNRLSFERELNKQLEIEEPTIFKIINDTTAEYRTMDDHCLLATVQWDFLALYHSAQNVQGPEQGSAQNIYEWTWAWALIPPEPGSVQDVVRKIIQESTLPKNFTNTPSIRFKDEILISYLLARISDMLKYPYIHIMKNDNGAFTAFGIRKVQWADYNPEAHKTQLYYSTISSVK